MGFFCFFLIHREPSIHPLFIQPTATQCSNQMSLCRFTKSTLPLPQTNICFCFFLLYCSWMSVCLCECHYARVTEVAPYGVLRVSPSDSRWWFLVTVRPSFRDPQLQMSCIRFCCCITQITVCHHQEIISPALTDFWVEWLHQLAEDWHVLRKCI